MIIHSVFWLVACLHNGVCLAAKQARRQPSYDTGDGRRTDLSGAGALQTVGGRLQRGPRCNHFIKQQNSTAAQLLYRYGRLNEGAGQIAFACLPLQAALALSNAIAYQQIRRMKTSFLMLAQMPSTNCSGGGRPHCWQKGAVIVTDVSSMLYKDRWPRQN